MSALLISLSQFQDLFIKAQVDLTLMIEGNNLNKHDFGTDDCVGSPLHSQSQLFCPV